MGPAASGSWGSKESCLSGGRGLMLSSQSCLDPGERSQGVHRPRPPAGAQQSAPACRRKAAPLSSVPVGGGGRCGCTCRLPPL